MRVLIACEFSGIVREAFIAQGHDAWSCDIRQTEINGPHIQGDILNVLDDGWDLMIAHPPCTHLTISAAHLFKHRLHEQDEALDFVQELLDADIPMVALENPIGVISTRIRKPDQIIQPWQFRHGETKATCLWLKNLPCLYFTDIVDGRDQRILGEAPNKYRWKNRSRTLQGIAKAMATQWGKLKPIPRPNKKDTNSKTIKERVIADF